MIEAVDRSQGQFLLRKHPQLQSDKILTTDRKQKLVSATCQTHVYPRTDKTITLPGVEEII